MLRLSIRELFLLVTIIALITGWAVDRDRMANRMRADRVAPFATELSEVLGSGTSIEIGQCGPGMQVQTQVLEGDTLEAFRRSAQVVDVSDFTGLSIASGAYIEFRVCHNDNEIASYTYFAPNGLMLERNIRWYMLEMREVFEQMMRDHVLKLD